MKPKLHSYTLIISCYQLGFIHKESICVQHLSWESDSKKKNIKTKQECIITYWNYFFGCYDLCLRVLKIGHSILLWYIWCCWHPVVIVKYGKDLHASVENETTLEKKKDQVMNKKFCMNEASVWTVLDKSWPQKMIYVFLVCHISGG